MLCGHLWVISGLALGQSQPQPLTVDPSNAHYWRGLDGKPVLFLSHGHFMTQMKSWQGYIDQCAAGGLNLVKEIGFEGNDGLFEEWEVDHMPYKRVPGSGKTKFGRDRWDLDRFDESYFELLGERAAYALKKGMYVQVQIWSSFPLRDGGSWGYDGGCFTPGNTVTPTAAYGFPGYGGEGSTTFYGSLKNAVKVGGKTLLERQTEFFDRVVGATKKYPNVFYELGVEVNPPAEWRKFWTDRLRQLASGKLIIEEIGYSGEPLEARPYFDGYTIHVWTSTDDKRAAELFALGKMAIYDTDVFEAMKVFDPASIRRTAWLAVLSGTHFTDWRGALVNDGTANVAWKNPDEVRYLSHIRKFFAARDIRFASLTPQDARATNGADLLAGGGAYVAYTLGKDFGLSLSSGKFTAEWYDPRNGTFSAPFRLEGGNQRFTPPTAEDWVLLARAE